MKKDIKKNHVTKNLNDILKILSPLEEKGINEKELLKKYTTKELESVSKLACFGVLSSTINLKSRGGGTIWSINKRGYSHLYEAEKDSLNFKQIKFQEQQVKIQKQQVVLIQKQTEFSRILMMATIVLAIGAFLQIIIQLINISENTYSNILNQIGFLGGIILFLGVIFFLGLMGAIVYLINPLFKKRL